MRTTTINAGVAGHAGPRTARLPAASARSAAYVFLALASMALAGCRQDMHDQPKYIPLRESEFFGDSRSARSLVQGVVARGQLRDDALLYTGKVNGADTTELPFPVDANVLARGQERFNIYCSPCHGRTGLGNGMVVQRGFRRPPSFADQRLRDAPIGHFFDVMTNGFGAMPDYAAQVRVTDRWAIAAYIRVLQRSEHATTADIAAGHSVTEAPETADLMREEPTLAPKVPNARGR